MSPNTRETERTAEKNEGYNSSCDLFVFSIPGNR